MTNRYGGAIVVRSPLEVGARKAPQIGKHLVRLPCANAARVDELAVIGVVAEQQRSKTRPRSFRSAPADETELGTVQNLLVIQAPASQSRFALAYSDSIRQNQSSLTLVPHHNGTDLASRANGVFYFGAGPCRFQITPSLQVIVRPPADSRPVLRKQATPSAPRGFPWNSPPYSFTHSASPPLTPMLGLASVRRQPWAQT
jgi:hypothetical protein